MTFRKLRRDLAVSILVAAGAVANLALLTPRAAAGVAAEQPGSRDAVAMAVWDAARGGHNDQLEDLLGDLATLSSDDSLTDSISLFRRNLDLRESTRGEKIDEVNAEFDEHIADYRETGSDVALSHALASAVALQLLMRDDDAFFADPRIARLLDVGERNARAAEAGGNWLIANELFYRLWVLLTDEGRFKEDYERLGKRLAMIRLYVPERLWELRNERRLAEEDGKPLPAYNPFGDDFRDKLSGIDEEMIKRAIYHAAQRHVSAAAMGHARGVSLVDLLNGGLDALETMVTTTDLSLAFPKMGDQNARRTFVRSINDARVTLAAAGDRIGPREMQRIIDIVTESNRRSVEILPTALLHEFGNGAMGVLDDYSAIIWPDELARFRRSTQGEFIGVGIQIQHNEMMDIEVVTPLEGTPAQLAGIRAGDIIKKVDGISAAGLGLDQAVEVITGPPDTAVALTVERAGDQDRTEELTFKLVRKRIDLPSVKGWSKTGPGDYDWDWFIDDDAKVGYVRLTGFSEDTTRDFDRAITTMKRDGLKALILDLRYNPGGLLDQAVNIASRFIDRGLIVETVNAQGRREDATPARRVGRSRDLGDIPVVVLINEGSASASEIVSGAIKAGAGKDKLDAIIIGQRSFGKGSVQNVFPLDAAGRSAMKLTTQYYKVDAPWMIHKQPGASEWGIEPDLTVEMLPSQETDAIMLRRTADVLPLDERGLIIEDADRPDPNALLTDGIDLQVHTALVVLQTRAAVRNALSTSMRD